MPALPVFTVLLGELPTLVRLELTRLLQAQPDHRVVGSASSADELVTLARRYKPTLVIIGEQNLLSLERLHRQHACPMLLYTSTAPLSGVLREAARWGVYHFVGPLQVGAEDAFRWSVLRQLQAAPTTAGGTATDVKPVRHIVSAKSSGLIVVGASTGGTIAVEHLVQSLHPALACTILVAVHLPAHFTASFVKRLARVTTLPVKVGRAGMSLEAGQIIVAPGGQNMVVESVKKGPWRVWQLNFTTEPSPCPDEPSVDLLMHSAAVAAGKQATGVVLTGLGCDGTSGSQQIRAYGGRVLVQSEESAAVFSMPHSVIRAGYANAVLTLEQMAVAINQRAVLPVESSYAYSSVEAIN